jgi:hypothetical protein
MRTAMKLSLGSLTMLLTAGAIVACGDARATESADLARDLELASAATLDLAGRGVDSANLASLETKPKAAPQPARVVRRGAGNRAVASRTPTVRATPDATADLEEVGEVQTLATGPAPDLSEPVAVAPIPRPVSLPGSGPAGDYGSGGGIFGGGSGRGGSGGGIVIRGGGVDGDNCELHRRPRGTTRGPVYVPVPVSSPAPTVSRPARGGGGIGMAPRPAVSRRPEPAGSSSRPSAPARPTTTRRGL